MPPITVFCAFTRLEFVDRWFQDLYSTDLNPENTNLVLIIDTAEPRIYAKIMEQMNFVKFKRFWIVRNYEHHVNEVNIPIRRRRIAEIHEQAKEYIRQTDGEYVLGLEDDTVFTNLCVNRLYQLASQEGVGFVSAYQAGRWHNKIIGIWQFNDIDDMKECWTVLPSVNIEECDAAGFYCYLTRTSRFMAHKYEWLDWQPWGPDVNYGIWLRQLGFKNYVDWSQPVGHQVENGIIWPNHNLYSEHFYINNDLGENAWVRRRQDEN